MRELERLERKVEKSKTLVNQSQLKVEELGALTQKIYRFKDKTLFPSKEGTKISADAQA